MDRYINIDLLLRLMEDLGKATVSKEWLDEWAGESNEYIAPIIHAQWIRKEYRIAGVGSFGIQPHCSHCDAVFLGATHNISFCPNCGAEMSDKL